MNQNKGFYIALTIFLIPILVITLSTAWYYLGFGPKTKVNYGDLIEPSLYLGELDLELDYQYWDIDSMERKWMMITFIKDRCDETCLETIYIARQVNVLLSREQGRFKRYVASTADELKILEPSLISNYEDLNFITINDLDLVESKFKESKVDLFQSTNLFVADPLGNVILYYSGDIDGKKLLADLKKLLKASKIG